jgi:DNA polymerase III delta prime subunit
MDGAAPQGALAFPQALTERYRPQTIAEFVGLDKPKKILSKLAAKPYESAWLFVGPSGTGKTTMAQALAAAIPAELHHIPSQECNLETIERVRRTCQYVPMQGCKMHLVLVDEAGPRLSRGAERSANSTPHHQSAARRETERQNMTMRRTKAAWIRDEGYPVGQPAPGHFNCSCGTRVPQVSDENVCDTCGTCYDARGWITFSPND